VRESYPLTPDRSSPAPPELPERPPPVRFQFSLRKLLAFMFVSALVAAGLRLFVLVVQQLGLLQQTALLNTTLCVLALVGLFYFFFRAPYLAMKSDAISHRWRQIQKHRDALDVWANRRRDEHNCQAPPSDDPPTLQ
jgi:hypothetical protein